MKYNISKTIYILLVLNSFGMLAAEHHVERTEDADSITYDDGSIRARYIKSLNSYTASIKVASRQSGYDTWHLTDPKDHYMRLKRAYELQQGEMLELKEPEESERGISEIREDEPNENF